MEDYPSNETKAALKRGETLMIAEINRVFDPAVVPAVVPSIVPAAPEWGSAAVMT